MSRTPQQKKGSRVYRDGWRAVNLLIRSDGSWSGRERKLCYRNRGDGKFDDVSFVSGLDLPGDGRAFVTMDIDGDGALDLVAGFRTAPQIRILRNQIASNGSLILELAGVKSNRDAIGAWATLVTDRRRLHRYVRSGSGFLSQSSRRLHFGIERGEKPRALEIEWPSGVRQSVADVPASGLFRVLENGAMAPIRTAVLAHRAQGDRAAAGTGTWLVEPAPAPPLPGIARGHKTLVNFWATWCPPCREELAQWTAAASRFSASGLHVLAASVDEPQDNQKVAAFVSRLNLPFQVVKADAKIVAAWSLLNRHLFDRRLDLGLPTSFLLDEQGRIVKIYKGPTPPAAILGDLAARGPSAFPFPGRWHGPRPGRNYVEMATAFAEHGLAAEAERWYELALARKTPDEESVNNFAGLLLEQGKLDRAETLLRSLRTPEAMANLGTLLLKRDQPREAAVEFQQALVRYPDDAFSENGLGSSLFKLGDLAGAERHFAEACRLDPETPDYQHNLGSVLARAGRFQEAIPRFEAAVKLRPDSLDALNGLAILYAETGQKERALEQFRRALSVDQNHAPTYLNMAMLEERLGNRREARRILGELLQRQPANEQAARMLNRLQ
ncbi:MAG: tetratricopeptide repeat protein [Acidobacteria bacterium]|nr:tetratricopeptide repeat protein [Acidobacteriota bacterium]